MSNPIEFGLIVLSAFIVASFVIVCANISDYFDVYVIEGNGSELYCSKYVEYRGERFKVYKPINSSLRKGEIPLVRDGWYRWPGQKATKLSFSEAWDRIHAKDTDTVTS